MNPTDQKPTELETILGGVEFDAVKLDGTTERVKILQLPLHSLQRYAQCLDDEPGQIELLCSKPAGWSKTLSAESAEHIVIEGERINADFFGRWFKRRLARQAAMLADVPEPLRAKLLSPLTSAN